jgi:predicted nucleic acid-binding protein
MFVVVDASVWVSRLVLDDVFHETVKHWMAEQREQGIQFVSPFLLLAEIGGAISRRTNIPALGLEAIQQVEKLPGVRLIEMDNALLRDTARLAAELGLRGADAAYVAVAVQLKLPLITLDIDQKAKAKAKVTCLEITN